MDRLPDENVDWDRRYDALAKIAKAANGVIKEQALELALQTERKMPARLEHVMMLAREYSNLGNNDTAQVLTMEAIGLACHDWSAWSTIFREGDVDLIERYAGAGVEDQLLSAGRQRGGLESEAAVLEQVRLRIQRKDLDQAVSEYIEFLERTPQAVEGAAPIVIAILENHREADLWPKLYAATQRKPNDVVRRLLTGLVRNQKPQYVIRAVELLADPDERGRALIFLLKDEQKDRTVNSETAAVWAKAAIDLLNPKRSEAYSDFNLAAEILLSAGYSEDAKTALERSPSKDSRLCVRIGGYLTDKERWAEAERWLIGCHASVTFDEDARTFWPVLAKLVDHRLLDRNPAAAMEFAHAFRGMNKNDPIDIFETDLIDILEVVSDRLWSEHHIAEAQQLDREALQVQSESTFGPINNAPRIAQLTRRLVDHGLANETRPLLELFGKSFSVANPTESSGPGSDQRRTYAHLVLASSAAIANFPDMAIAELLNALRDQDTTLERWEESLLVPLKKASYADALHIGGEPEYPVLLIETRLRSAKKLGDAERDLTTAKGAEWAKLFFSASNTLSDPMADIKGTRLGVSSPIFRERMRRLVLGGHIDRALSETASLTCVDRFDLYYDWLGYTKVSEEPLLQDRLFGAILQAASESPGGENCPIEKNGLEHMIGSPIGRRPESRPFLIRLASQGQEWRFLVAIALATQGQFRQANAACGRCDGREMAALTNAMLQNYYGLTEQQ
jgi:hypothetical protein